MQMHQMKLNYHRIKLNRLELNKENLVKILETDKGKKQMQEDLRNLQRSTGWKFILAVLETWVEDYQIELDNIDKPFKDGEIEELRIKKVLLQRLLKIPSVYINDLENVTSDIEENVGDPYE